MSRAVVGVACAVLGAGCELEASPDEAIDDAIAEHESALYANTGFFWPTAGTGRTDINVCWENPNSAPGTTAAARATWRDQRRRAVEESWGRNARINFYGWDGNNPVIAPTVCVSGAPGIHVVICTLPTDSRCPALPASQATAFPTVNGLNNGVRLNPDHGASVAVHEFGHTLGFYHEEERPDSPNITSGPCAKQSFPNANPISYGAYDPTSTMSYCQPISAAPWLSANDVASIQRAYGRRIQGTLATPRANCAAAHHAVGLGDRAFTWDCDEANRDQEWFDTTLTSNGDAWSLFIVGPTSSTRFCLGATSASAGAAVQLATCSTGNDWRLESMFLRGFGGRCLDLRAGVLAAGTPIQIWDCGAIGGANQRWSRTRAGQIRFGTTAWCARVGANSHLELGACNTADPAQIFTFDASVIRQVSTGLCLDVQGPSDAQFISGQGLLNNGEFVHAFTCNTALNQRWAFRGGLRYDGNTALCLNRGSDGNGSALSLATCNGNDETQTWDYSF